MSYQVSCPNGHSKTVDIDELAELLEDQNCFQDGCSEPLSKVDPEELSVECTDCGWQEHCDWRTATGWLWSDCPRCISNTETEGHIRIVGTLAHAVGEYESFAPKVKVDNFRREDRPDYWELVAHYTRRDAFISILKNKKIEARNTGYFHVPSVCFTDVPVEFNTETKRTYGEYGLVFRKSDIITAGGGPVIYLSDQLIQSQKPLGFADAMKPFVNLVRLPATAPSGVKARRVNFLHDREWRFPSDLKLDSVVPVGLILPSRAKEKGRFRGPDGRYMIESAWEYGEIY